MSNSGKASANAVQVSIGGQLTSSSAPLSEEGRWAFNFNQKSKLTNIEVHINSSELLTGSSSILLSNDLSNSDIQGLIQWLTSVKESMNT